MEPCGILVASVIALIIAVSLHEVAAIKCWRCTSNEAFCNDPFDPSNITDQERLWNYIECTESPGHLDAYKHSHLHPPVCVKYRQLIHGKYLTTRSCSWEDENKPKAECLRRPTPDYIKTEFCEICQTDGCNGAAQYGPITLLVAISAILAKILLL